MIKEYLICFYLIKVPSVSSHKLCIFVQMICQLFNEIIDVLFMRFYLLFHHNIHNIDIYTNTILCFYALCRLNQIA